MKTVFGIIKKFTVYPLFIAIIFVASISHYVFHNLISPEYVSIEQYYNAAKDEFLYFFGEPF